MTEENTEKKDAITFRLENDEDNTPKLVVLKIEGLDIEYPFEFETIEDAKTAMKFGGTLFDCFKGMLKLGASAENVTVEAEEKKDE